MPQANGLIGLIIFAVIAAILLAAVASYIGGRRRIQALSAWARQKGLSFNPARDRSLAYRFPEFAVFQKGNNAYGYNLVHGIFRRPLRSTPSTTTTRPNTRSRFARPTARAAPAPAPRPAISHHHFSAVVVEPELPLKPLLIRPEGLFDKVADFFGKGDLDFESAEFSRRYHVTAPDRRWAYDVLHARVIDFLLDQPRLVVEFTPQHVLIMRPGERLMTPELFDAAVRTADEMLDLLPAYVRADA